MLKSRISLKLGTIDGCGEMLTSTKNKVAILNSLGFRGIHLKMTKSTQFGCWTSRKNNFKSNQQQQNLLFALYLITYIKERKKYIFICT